MSNSSNGFDTVAFEASKLESSPGKEFKMDAVRKASDRPMCELLGETGEKIYEIESIVESIANILIRKTTIVGEDCVVEKAPETESVNDVIARNNYRLDSIREKTRAIHQQLEWNFGNKLDLR